MPPSLSYSFSKDRRLKQAWEFERVRRDGSSQGGKLLILGSAVVPDSAMSRAGFITSRQLGSAVARNRVRRRLREIVRRHQHDLRKDVWMVVVARPAAVNASYQALEHEWLRLASRASILL